MVGRWTIKDDQKRWWTVFSSLSESFLAGVDFQFEVQWEVCSEHGVVPIVRWPWEPQSMYRTLMN